MDFGFDIYWAIASYSCLDNHTHAFLSFLLSMSYRNKTAQSELLFLIFHPPVSFSLFKKFDC